MIACSQGARRRSASERRPAASCGSRLRSCSSSSAGRFRSGIHWARHCTRVAKAGDVGIVGRKGPVQSRRGRRGERAGDFLVCWAARPAIPPARAHRTDTPLSGRDLLRCLVEFDDRLGGDLFGGQPVALDGRGLPHQRFAAARHRHRRTQTALRRPAPLRRPAARRGRRPSRRGGCPARGGGPGGRDRRPDSDRKEWRLPSTSSGDASPIRPAFTHRTATAGRALRRMCFAAPRLSVPEFDCRAAPAARMLQGVDAVEHVAAAVSVAGRGARRAAARTQERIALREQRRGQRGLVAARRRRSAFDQQPADARMHGQGGDLAAQRRDAVGIGRAQPHRAIAARGRSRAAGGGSNQGTRPGRARSSTAPAAPRRPDRRAESPAARSPADCDAPLPATAAGRRPAACDRRGRRAGRPRPCEIGDSSSRSRPVRSSYRSMPRQAAIDDAGDALDRQRGLGHVRREDDLPRSRRAAARRPAARPAGRRRAAAAPDPRASASDCEAFFALANFADAGQEHSSRRAVRSSDLRHALRDQIDQRAAIEVRQIADHRPETSGPGFRRSGSRPGSAAIGSAASVADMTTIRSSGRTDCCTWRTIARARSLASDRSWNSSKTTAPTSGRNGSSSSRRSRMPSVMIAIRVRGPTSRLEAHLVADLVAQSAPSRTRLATGRRGRLPGPLRESHDGEDANRDHHRRDSAPPAAR